MFPECEAVLRSIVQGNYHRGGLKCRRLFRVDAPFFEQLVAEVRRLVQSRTPSIVGPVGHVTSWTQPYGSAVQFSLLNESGKFDDYSTDHNRQRAGKRFHYPAEFPTLQRFIDAFPDAYNMRLNGMGNKSGLSPHEEHVVSLAHGGGVQVRARFHLPVCTSPGAEMLLDGDVYHFDAGYVYFFNNGCVHSAVNQSTEHRYHLVWDALLTQDSFHRMFRGEGFPRDGDHFRFLDGEEAMCSPLRQVDVQAYATSGPGRYLYDFCRMKYLFIKPHSWQNLYNSLEYWYIKNKPCSWWESVVGDSKPLYGHDVRD
jgi:hypothetical protein